MAQGRFIAASYLYARTATAGPQVKVCDFAFSKLKQQVVEESPPPPPDDNCDSDGDGVPVVQSAAARSTAAPRAPRGGRRPEPRPTWGDYSL